MCFSKKKTFTLIARFDQTGYDKLDSILSLIDEKVCRVPYCRVPDSDRYAVDNLQLSVYDCLRNEKYLPVNNVPHITIAISRNHDKIQRIKSAIESDFKPFVLTIDSLGLYRIWPGELIRDYKQRQN